MHLMPPGVSLYVLLTAPRRARALRRLAYTQTHTRALLPAFKRAWSAEC